jgi:DnaK suppressor protein
MEYTPAEQAEIRERLINHKRELEQRVERIHEHAREPLDPDSSEQAAQLGNVQVVAALEHEAVHEIAQIDAALRRLENGQYGACVTCGEPISPARLTAHPASAECVDCAETSPAP